jgi:hypothetical protein
MFHEVDTARRQKLPNLSSQRGPWAGYFDVRSFSLCVALETGTINC